MKRNTFMLLLLILTVILLGSADPVPARASETEVSSGGETNAEEAVPGGDEDFSARVGEGASMPAWYPVYPKLFPAYHDADAPRVVDTADLFSDDEEAQMTSRLIEVRDELQKDIIIFTDTSTYGLERKVYAADFYDFNGYGIGDDYEGVLLFICMDPNDRGWWTNCTGPETKRLYTEEIANQVDDMLYEYMVNGQYFDGVKDWIENFRRLYLTGSPYTPDWAVQDPASFTRFHDKDAPRIVDDAHILSEEDIRSLTEKASQISSKYGLDVVVHTAPHPGSMSGQDYSDRFYYYKGYGFGDDYDGILYTVFKKPGYSASTELSAFGKGAQKLTDVNRSRLLSRSSDLLSDKEYSDAISLWLDNTEHMLRTGRVPRSSIYWFIMCLFELMIGILFGGISLFIANKKMETPVAAEDADRYYVRDSLKMRKVSDIFLHTSRSRSYSPQQTRSGGSSSGGGRSSYSGSFSGSSGRSHSGSGRNF